MPKFSAAIDTQRIPVKGLTPETASTAPTDPVVGQLWVDTSTTPRLLKVWDGAAWAVANMYAGTTADTFAAGNDSRITGAEQVASKGAANGYASLDGAGDVPYAQLPVGTAANTVAAGNDGRITGAEQLTNKNAANGYAGLDSSTKVPLTSLYIAASGASSATSLVRADDQRLSDTRTPTDNSVTAVKIPDSTITDAKIAEANKDGAAGTPSLRTIGTTATSAMAGNRALHTISAPTASLDLNGQRITNLAAPVANTDAARLADVQSAAAGIDAKGSARVRTTTNVNTTSPGASLDGVAMTAGDRVLLNGQTTATENDIWIWNGATSAMTRSADTISPNTFLFVEEGTFGDSQWVVTNNGTITRGTTVIVWTQFGGASSYTGTANRITVNGTAVDIAATYVGQTSITTLGTITAGTWNGNAVAIGFGGTGATTAAAARTNLGAGRAGFAVNVGAMTAGTPLAITHSLGTQDVIVQVREVSSQAHVELDVTNTSTSQVTLRSDVAYAANALRVVVLPVA